VYLENLVSLLVGSDVNIEALLEACCLQAPVHVPAGTRVDISVDVPVGAPPLPPWLLIRWFCKWGGSVCT